MDIRRINDEYSVSSQIAVEDVKTVKDQGFKSIVCHRPDGEAPEQTGFADIKAEAERLGLEIRQVPFGAEGVSADQVHAFVDCLDEMPRPMLGYCRSGARSTKIYEMTRHIRN
ncbi:TIGR01244 family sulfur transferase [Pararhizobium haloflavum]|uniref:TIGR01244 family sulfur transferase n=1 Tax=Pararhizobium haloflavum TaxID=2037914 RepID=UPI000C18DA2A|nr:TIGR01244 family sulfur transferase [Pararhizobium haloflavum]